MENWFDEIPFALGALIVVLGVRAFMRTRTFIARCSSADGRVTHYTTQEDDDAVSYHPRVRFRDANGAEHEIPAAMGQPHPPTVGYDVGVTYDSSNPTNAWITGSARPWFVPWFVFILGVAVVIGGFVVRWES